MAFREAAQAQSRHRLQQDMVLGSAAKAKSLRQQKMRISVAGRMGALHAIHGSMRGTAERNFDMFEEIVGLVDDGDGGEDNEESGAAKAEEAKALAERIYMACLTGDCETLQQALVPLITAAAPPPAPDEPEPPPPPAKGGKGDKGAKGAKAPPEPEFTPELEIEVPPPPSWRIVDARGIEPLAHACNRGHAEAARLLLSARANVEAAARTCGRTALHRAAEAGHLEAVKALLEHGADPAAPAKSGSCPLLAAAGHGRQDVVAHLLALREGGVAPCEGTEAAGAEGGDELPRRCPVDQRDHAGTTALMVAARGGHVAVCEALVDAGADPQALDMNGWGPLHHACRGGQREAAMILVRHGSAVRPTKGMRKLHELDAKIAAEAEAEAEALRAAAAEDEDEDGNPRPLTAPP